MKLNNFPCPNCKELPLYIKMTPENFDHYEWDVDNIFYNHLIMHNNLTCNFKRYAYDITKQKALHGWVKFINDYTGKK